MIKRNTSRRLRGAAILTALALLGGCLSLGGKAPKLMVGLSPEKTAPAGTLASGQVGDAVVVLDPETARKLDVLRIAVQVNDTEIAYLKDVAWVERPARLFRHVLAEAIRAKGGRLVLEAGDDATGARLMLGGRLTDLDYDARRLSAVARFDAMREDGKGAVEVRRFEAVVPGVGSDPKEVAQALNRAANQVAAQVADWIA